MQSKVNKSTASGRVGERKCSGSKLELSAHKESLQSPMDEFGYLVRSISNTLVQPDLTSKLAQHCTVGWTRNLQRPLPIYSMAQVPRKRLFRYDVLGICANQAPWPGCIQLYFSLPAMKHSVLFSSFPKV